MSKPTVTNFIHALIAVVAGNAIYFLLMPHLPPPARHVLFREDLGVVVAFCICLLIFVALKTVSRSKNSSNSQNN